MNLNDVDTREHIFCSRCGNKMIKVEDREEYEPKFDTKTGEKSYRTRMGKLRCNQIIPTKDGHLSWEHDEFDLLFISGAKNVEQS